MGACYGITTPTSSMTKIRQKLWAQKTGKSTAAPKLCSLPPTTEAFEQNVRRAHHQVAHWYSALSGDPPTLAAVEHGWEADDTNKVSSLEIWRTVYPTPRSTFSRWSDVAAHLSEHVEVGNVAVWGAQIPCTMFCTCGGGTACSNPFSITQSATDHADIPDDSDEAKTTEQGCRR
ncbi:hypothetical protein GWK47_015536 [Chionoecetes opilio]|uniref:Uncharacterized protein n=1 Tax=Chionoecetes opilio TaxID=41210 RepID=A0A8J5CMY6_CHIOP|nr:hypothetical protein GWK47_015536 [Chionoecetes opilio]